MPLVYHDVKFVEDNIQQLLSRNCLQKLTELLQLFHVFLQRKVNAKLIVYIYIYPNLCYIGAKQKNIIHHYPRALFNDIPMVGVYFYDIPGSVQQKVK